MLSKNPFSSPIKTIESPSPLMTVYERRIQELELTITTMRNQLDEQKKSFEKQIYRMNHDIEREKKLFEQNIKNQYEEQMNLFKEELKEEMNKNTKRLEEKDCEINRLSNQVEKLKKESNFGNLMAEYEKLSGSPFSSPSQSPAKQSSWQASTPPTIKHCFSRLQMRTPESIPYDVTEKNQMDDHKIFNTEESGTIAEDSFEENVKKLFAEGIQFAPRTKYMEKHWLELRKYFPTDAFLKVKIFLESNYSSSLYLSNSLIDDFSCKALVASVQSYKKLTYISLSNNSIGDEGFKYISEILLRKNTIPLKILRLNHNTIGDEGVKVFSDVLKYNNTLTGVELNDNQIGNIGALNLADAIRMNNTLQEIDLQNNHNITDDGARALLVGMRSNVVITKLFVKNKSISNDLVKQF